MPKSSNHLALARQWEMLKKLPARGPGITASELTSWLKDEGFAVSKRTVERDLNELSSQFGIMCNDASMPYGWHWIPGKQYEFGSVEMSEAVSLTVAEDILKKMLPAPMLTALEQKFSQARSKLDALEEHPYSKWTNKVRYVPMSMNTIPPNVDLKLLEAVQDALLKELQIEVEYMPFNSEKKHLTLHPLSLIQRGNTPYLTATVHTYDNVLLFAIHRIRKVEVTARKVNVPGDYKVDDYIAEGAMEFWVGDIITLKAKLSDELATYLTETPIAEEQKINHRSGSWQITAKVRDSYQLRMWILSQASGVTVLAPKALREQIKQQHLEAAKVYE